LAINDPIRVSKRLPWNDQFLYLAQGVSQIKPSAVYSENYAYPASKKSKYLHLMAVIFHDF